MKQLRVILPLLLALLFTLFSTPQRAMAQNSSVQEAPPLKQDVPAPTGKIVKGVAIKRVEPVYPPLAVNAKISGKVVVSVTVDTEGNVIEAKVVSGHPLLNDAAVAAARAWKFTPTTLDGKPTQLVGTLDFNFNWREYPIQGKSLQTLQDEVRLNPDSAEARFKLGLGFRRVNQNLEAIPELKEAVRLKPDHAEAHFSLGEAYAHLKQFETSIKHFEQALTINPDFAEARFGIAGGYFALGQTDKSMEILHYLVKNSLNFAPSHYVLGMIYYRRNQRKEAIESFKRGFLIDTTEDGVSANLRILNDQILHDPKATETIKDAVSRYRLAMAYLQVGDEEGALRAYEGLKILDAQIADALLREINKRKVK